MSTPDIFDLAAQYDAPPGYDPPVSFEDQTLSLEYPNVNTAQYRQKPVEYETKLWPFFQCFDRNSEGTVILGTNTYRSRLCYGSIFAYDNVDEELVELESKEVAFKIRTETPVSAMKFISDTVVLMGESDGGLTLFSTKSEMRETKQSNYCLFTIGKSHEHNALVSSLDIFRVQRQKAVTTDTDSQILIWDLANADLTSVNSIRQAHSDTINDVTTALNNDDTFITASDDKSLLLWDLRDPRPSSSLLENHQFQLKAVTYLSENEVLVGDRAGIMYLMDTKMPKKFILEREIHNRPIHRFIVNEKNVIVLTDSNRVVVQEFNGTEFNLILDAIEAPNFLRDAAWINESEFFVAGWSSYLKKYKI